MYACLCNFSWPEQLIDFVEIGILCTFNVQFLWLLLVFIFRTFNAQRTAEVYYFVKKEK